MGIFQESTASPDPSRRTESWCAAVRYNRPTLANHSAGRAWTVGELRSRDWESLHQLWWMCVKERNRLATATIELQRLDVGSGELENEERDKVVQETMKAILDTLAERQQAYREAYALARKDPTIDLSVTDGPQLLQTPYVGLVLHSIEDSG